MYPLAAGAIVETKDVWEELMISLKDLPVRLVFEMIDLPDDLSDLLDRIDRLRPDVVLLEVTRLRRPLEEVVRRLRSTAAQPAVFALYPTAAPDAILNALRAGVTEYLHFPFENTLKAACERLAHSREKARDGHRRGGKTVGFVSSKGGCGATTVACHVAQELPRLVHTKVLLADLDLEAGMVSFLAKVRSPYSIADAANNLKRLDASYWRGLVWSGTPDLEIIQAPASPSAKQIEGAQLKQVLAFARMQYDWSILDLGRNLSDATLSMLDLIDETYVVTTPEPPALHQARQMIEFILDSGYDRAHLHLLLNRFPERAGAMLEKVENTLGLAVFATLLNDDRALHDAYAEGQLVDHDAALGQNFVSLAARIAGVAEPAKKRRSLFGFSTNGR